MGMMVGNAGMQTTIHIWDAVTGKGLHTLSLGKDVLWSMAVAPDGDKVALASTQGNVEIWDAAKGTRTHTIPRQNMAGGPIGFAPDGKTLAVGQASSPEMSSMVRGVAKRFLPLTPFLSADDPKAHVTLWDVATGKRVRDMDGAMTTSALTFSRDGRRLAAAGTYAGIHVWDAATGKKTFATSGHDISASTVAFANDGKKIACGTSDNLVRLWDMTTGNEVLPPQGHQAAIHALAFTPDGRTLATSAGDGTTRLWAVAGGQSLRSLSDRVKTGTTDNAAAEQEQRGTAALGFSKDGVELRRVGQTYQAWVTATGRERRRLTLVEGAEASKAGTISADGTMLAVLVGSRIELWDATTGAARATIDKDQAMVHGMALAPDGRLLALALTLFQANAPAQAPEMALALIDTSTGKEIRKFTVQPESQNPFAYVAGSEAGIIFSPDGNLLATAGVEGICLCDIHTGKEIRRLPISEGAVSESLAFSPDGRMLAVGDNARQIRIWEIATGQERLRLEGHRGTPTCLAFDRACRILASGSNDTTVLLWDLTGSLPPYGGAPEPPSEPSDALWTDLAEANAARAYRAIWALVRQPAAATGFLAARLRPAIPASPERLDALIADLDSDRFEVRSQAAADLEALHELAAPALRKTAAGGASLEVKRKAQELLSKLEAGSKPDAWRQLRAVEALEHMNVPESKQLLKTLAAGAPEARLTQEAKKACVRLEE
jgi:WD40 repeat protein